PHPPYVFASTSHGRYYSPQKNAYTAFAVTKQGGRLKALRTLLIVNKKVKEYGFLKDELKRAKKDLLSNLEAQYKGRKTQTSTSYVSSYIFNFLYESPIPGITWKY